MNDNKKNDEITLQSKIFGHRFKPSQSVYEYLLEFLIVAFAEKKDTCSKELFPISENKGFGSKFQANNNLGLKRFVFFNKSKEDGKSELDKYAYNNHVLEIKHRIEINSDYEFLTKDYAIDIMQNLLYSFSAITDNRSWFAQSLLPICESALTTETMMKAARKNKENKFKNIDSDGFDQNRYSFMARGGEVYYLHILNAIINNPDYKNVIEDGFENLIKQFEEFEDLCSTIQNIWIEYVDEQLLESATEINSYEEKKDNRSIKTLGKIPEGFKFREKCSLIELENILSSDMQPFEKLDLLSIGVIVQIIIMTYDQARYVAGKDKGYLIFDVNCYKGESNEEVKKIATINFNSYVQDILDSLYFGVSETLNRDKNGEKKSEDETIKDAIKDSLNVYKKLGKSIGIIRPINEKFARFTLDEKILKFIVLSLVKPNTKITFDRFLDKLYKHFRIVVSKEKLLEVDEKYNATNASFLDINKNDLQMMMKESGFLRELSDSTSIVENPYNEVCYAKVYQ